MALRKGTAKRLHGTGIVLRDGAGRVLQIVAASDGTQIALSTVLGPARGVNLIPTFEPARAPPDDQSWARA